jgi:hypothetical protein
MGANLQNIPKRGPLAKPFRKCLVARPGHKLVEGDLVSAEAVIIGWLSGDPVLQRIAPLGMHKFAMASYLKVPVDLNWTDEKLAELFNELKAKEPSLYDTIKTTVYGSFYLAGPRTIFERNPEEFSGQSEAKKFQQIVFDALPQIRVWQRKIVNREYKYGVGGRNWGWSGNRLINPFGYSIEYWDPQDDGPASCAFLPQSTIGSIMKETLLQFKHKKMETWNWLIMQVHDAWVSDCPVEPHDYSLCGLCRDAGVSGVVEGRLAATAKEMEEAMGQKWPQLNGLAIPVEIAVKDSL